MTPSDGYCAVRKKTSRLRCGPVRPMCATAALAVDNGLSALTYLSMPDGSPTVLRYKRSLISDNAQSYLVYRHDMIFCVDFSSLQTAQATQVKLLLR